MRPQMGLEFGEESLKYQEKKVSSITEPVEGGWRVKLSN